MVRDELSVLSACLTIAQERSVSDRPAPAWHVARSTMAAMILLTGASGYGGSRLHRRLEEDGCAVRCLAPHDGGHRP